MTEQAAAGTTVPWGLWLGAGAIILVAAVTAAIKLANWHGAVNTDRTNFKKFMDEVRDDIKKILQRLPASPVTAQSPLRLTDLGERISQELDAPSIIRELSTVLRGRASGKLAYEIQELSFEYIQEEYQPPEDLDRRIMQCAFDNGLKREQVLEVLGVLLRDELLPLAKEGSDLS